MPDSRLRDDIIRTLLYYEIFNHPLSVNELFYLLPRNSISKATLIEALTSLTTEGTLIEGHNFYHLRHNGTRLDYLRLDRQRRAGKRMAIARIMAHVIKRFPFVRGIFISGDLSKGVANPDSDIDYVIITIPHRLWICRTLLMLFKKIFLLNQRTFFCLNYYLDADHLRVDEENYYTATEIAHLKPLYNFAIYLRFMNANSWIKNYFPNYWMFSFVVHEGNNRQSMIQRLVEFPFSGRWADRFDLFLMKKMKKLWAKRYPQYDETTREQIFRCTEYESRAYVGNFSDRVLSLYQDKLHKHGFQ